MPLDFLDWIEKNKEKFIEISDSIWRFAEIGLLEEKSSHLLIETLKEAGFTIEQGIAGMPTAFIASHGTSKPVVAILGEFDALPGLSQTSDPIKKPFEEGAPGHGCGHNLLGVAGLTACLALKESFDNGDFQGTIRYYGCPAEENVDAKGGMVKAGAFSDVDISLTWHPWDFNMVVTTNFQAIYSVVFNFKGKTAHAAADPYHGRSALDAVELMNVGCNYLREHLIPDARLHYIITKGGQAPNIVPDEAAVWYFVRAAKLDQLAEIYPRVVKVAKGAALMTETEVEIDFQGGSANLLPNLTLEDLLYEKMNQIGSPTYDQSDQDYADSIIKTFEKGYFDRILATYPIDMQKELEKLRGVKLHKTVIPLVSRGVTLPGSTDVGDVSWVTPLAQFATTCTILGTPGHSWQLVAQAGMSIGHKGMLYAAKVLALASFELFTNPELVLQAKSEFNKKITRTPYKSPLPDDWKPPIEYIKSLYSDHRK